MFYNMLQSIFKGLCIIATTCMVIFWLVTFSKNEDVSKIEIKYFEKYEDITLPEFNACFQNPFIDDRFKEVDSGLSREGYQNYLSGTKSDNGIYPNKLKIITQSQAVDFQALIGYVGGYIGLFLGN